MMSKGQRCGGHSRQHRRVPGRPQERPGDRSARGEPPNVRPPAHWPRGRPPRSAAPCCPPALPAGTPRPRLINARTSAVDHIRAILARPGASGNDPTVYAGPGLYKRSRIMKIGGAERSSAGIVQVWAGRSPHTCWPRQMDGQAADDGTTGRSRRGHAVWYASRRRPHPDRGRGVGVAVVAARNAPTARPRRDSVARTPCRPSSPVRCSGHGWTGPTSASSPWSATSSSSPRRCSGWSPRSAGRRCRCAS